MTGVAAPHRRPFPGMRPFLPGEADLFYGQSEHISALVKRLGGARLIAVFGESGCGKSSIVQAGLIPRLLGGRVDPQESLWRIAISRPGTAPIAQLAERLSGAVSASPAAEIEATLRSSSYGLLDIVRGASLERGRRVLIVIDQFEELFRFTRDADDVVGNQDEAALFVKLLLAATEPEACLNSGIPVYVVLTMRSEYLGDCARFFGLAEAVNDGGYLLPKMTRANIETAILGPAQAFGADVDRHLLQCLLNETEAAHQDGLPLLQHALRRIWDTAASRPGPVRLTMADFEDVPHGDGLLIERHLNAHLERILDSLPSEQRRTAERIFKQLGEFDSKGRLIRRSCVIATLAKACGVEVADALPIVDAFRDDTRGRTFLMPPTSRTQALLDGDEPLDISHEALLRHWARLRTWVDDETRSAEEFRLLATRAEQHTRISGIELARALEWRAKTSPSEPWSRRYAGSVHGGRRRYDYGEAMAHLDACRRRERLKALRRVSLIAAILILGVTAIFFFDQQRDERGQALAEAELVRRQQVEEREYRRQLEATNGELNDVAAARAQLIGALEQSRMDLEAERARLQTLNAELEAAKAILERRNEDLGTSQQELEREIAEKQKAIADAMAAAAMLAQVNEELEEEQAATAALDKRREADQMFRTWASMPSSEVTLRIREHLPVVVSSIREYLTLFREAPGDAVFALRRAVAASYITSVADSAVRAPVLFARPDPVRARDLAAIRQGALVDGTPAQDPAAWSIQRVSAIPGSGTAVVGGPGGFVALIEPGQTPALRKFHPFAVTGVGISTDGAWIASASASGDMRLLKRADLDRPSAIGQMASRSIMAGKLVTYMLLQKYKGDYPVREFAISVAPHPGRPAERNDVTVVALTQGDRLLVWRTPGRIGKQITSVDDLEIGGRFGTVAANPATQRVWAARLGTVPSAGTRTVGWTELGTLSLVKGISSFSPCPAMRLSDVATVMAWDGAGARLAVGMQDGTIRIFTRTGPDDCAFAALMDLPAHDATVTSVAWHARDMLATGAEDGSAALWNLALTPQDTQMLATLRGVDSPAGLDAVLGLLDGRLRTLAAD